MTINDKNYIGVNTTIVGYAATDPRNPAYDKDGTRGIKQIPIAINEGYKPKDGGEFVKTGTTWYDVETTEDFLDDNFIQKGDKIRVDNARQEVREYTDREGNKKLGITLKFGRISILDGSDGDGSGHGYSDDTPF